MHTLCHKLRDSEDLQVLAQQESEVKTTLTDLKERRKRFGDCSVQATLRARNEAGTRIKELFESTQAKFSANKANIEGLLTLDSTKPDRKKILTSVKDNELVEYAAKIAEFDGVWSKMTTDYRTIENEIGDFGELLKDCELKTCCDFIARLGTMQAKLTNLRHAVTDMDSNIDLMKVKIGELDIFQATQEYNDQKVAVTKEFNEMNSKCELLANYAKECEEYASDREEKDLAETTHGGLSSFQKTISIRQTESVDEKLSKLSKIAASYERAMNKDDVKRNAFKVIAELEKMFARMQETCETGWTSL